MIRKNDMLRCVSYTHQNFTYGKQYTAICDQLTKNGAMVRLRDDEGREDWHSLTHFEHLVPVPPAFSAPTFKKGDRILCNTARPYRQATQGKIYTALSDSFWDSGEELVELHNDLGNEVVYPVEQFTLVSPALTGRITLPPQSITPIERLGLIAEQLAGMQAPGYLASDSDIQARVTTARKTVDELLLQEGFSISS